MREELRSLLRCTGWLLNLTLLNHTLLNHTLADLTKETTHDD